MRRCVLTCSSALSNKKIHVLLSFKDNSDIPISLEYKIILHYAFSTSNASNFEGIYFMMNLAGIVG